MADREAPAELCPRCARRPQETLAGLCEPCTIERASERFALDDYHRAKLRTIGWQERTTRADAPHAVLRQRRHRLRAVVRPRRPATAGDPWEIAAEALQVLNGRLRPAVGSNASAREALEEVREAIRRLAWGPSDD